MKMYFLTVAIFCSPVLVKCQGVFISPGISITAKAGTLTVKENWINNGSFIQDAALLNFAGDTQTWRGTANTVYNNVTIATGSVTTINSSQSLKGVLLS